MTLRSEEVQDIIERMPTRWCALTAFIMFILVCILTALSFLISYPDTIDGEITITGVSAPVRLLSSADGKLHLIAPTNKQIANGAIIAYIENGATFKDIVSLKRSLKENKIILSNTLNLGELGNAYNSYVVATQHWYHLSHSKRYQTMRKSLEKHINASKNISEQLSQNLKIKAQVSKNIQEEFTRDSILAKQYIVTNSELSKSQNSYLNQIENESYLHNTLLEKEAEISNSQTEIAKSHIEEEEQVEEAYVDMMSKRNILQSELQLWEKKYLIKAPMDGRLDYLGFWRENVYVLAGTELFSVVLQRNNVIGEAFIPSVGAGKVRIGQNANVKLNDYPYDEFGLLKGRVKSISRVTNKTSTKKSVTETYRVQIIFPNGLTSNFGNTLHLNFDSKGTVEIVTKNKHLIERLFDNLKATTAK